MATTDSVRDLMLEVMRSPLTSVAQKAEARGHLRKFAPEAVPGASLDDLMASVFDGGICRDYRTP